MIIELKKSVFLILALGLLIKIKANENSENSIHCLKAQFSIAITLVYRYTS